MLYNSRRGVVHPHYWQVGWSSFVLKGDRSFSSSPSLYWQLCSLGVKECPINCSSCGLHWRYPLLRMKVSTPCLAFFEGFQSCGCVCALVTALCRWKSRLSTEPLLVWVWVGPQFFVVFPRVEQLLSESFSVLLGCPFSGAWGIFVFACVRWHFQVDFLSPNLGYMREKENSQNSSLYHSFGPEVPSWLTFFSPPCRVFSFLS